MYLVGGCRLHIPTSPDGIHNGAHVAPGCTPHDTQDLLGWQSRDHGVLNGQAKAFGPSSVINLVVNRDNGTVPAPLAKMASRGICQTPRRHTSTSL